VDVRPAHHGEYLELQLSSQAEIAPDQGRDRKPVLQGYYVDFDG
jgi:hypothetical protein